MYIVGISRWQKSKLSVFKAKKGNYVVFFISNNYYIYLKRYFGEILMLLVPFYGSVHNDRIPKLI